MSFVGAAARARCHAPGQARRIRSPGMFWQPRGVSSEPPSAAIHRDGLAAPQVLLGALHQHGQPAARHAALLDGTHQLQELVELHLPVFVEVHLVEDLVEGVLVHLHADALQHTLHVQDRYEALLVLVKHAEPLLVPLNI